MKTVNTHGKNIFLKYSKFLIKGVSNMGYLICQECGGYYKLEKGESEEDFISCECYGSLTYVNNIAGYLKENNKVDKHPSMNKTDKSTVTEILDLGQNSDNNGNDILGKEALQINSKTESFSFPSFNRSDSQRVKDRNYYRKINSKEKRPDIEKLKRIKDVRGIIEALDYKDSEVKLEAVKALGSIGDERALKPLEKVKTVGKGVLKTYAQNAIFHIESKNRGLKSRNRAYYRNEFNNKSPSSNIMEINFSILIMKILINPHANLPKKPNSFLKTVKKPV